jgi:hypothetical protein
MRIALVDNKRNVMMEVKVEINKFVFIFAPEVKHNKFRFLERKIKNIREKYLELYLNNQGLDEQQETIIIDEIRDIMNEEIKRIHITEGIMYYTV